MAREFKKETYDNLVDNSEEQAEKYLKRHAKPLTDKQYKKLMKDNKGLQRYLEGLNN